MLTTTHILPELVNYSDEEFRRLAVRALREIEEVCREKRIVSHKEQVIRMTRLKTLLQEVFALGHQHGWWKTQEEALDSLSNTLHC